MNPAPPLLGALLASTLLACDGSCFVRGTRVSTPRGWRPIESLAEGDEVVSFDPVRGETHVRRLREVLQRKVARVLRVEAGEIVLAGVSPEHPLWDAHAGSFRPAASLSLESRLLVMLPGERAPRELAVTAVALVPGRGEIEVWNLEVDGEEHTYFAEGILVHNKQCGGDDCGGGGFGAPGNEPDCSALRDEPAEGANTAVRIRNAGAAPITLYGVDGCGPLGRVDGVPAVLAGREGTCQEAIEGTAVLGDCEPTFETLEPGATVERLWTRQLTQDVPVPEECDSQLDDVDFSRCSRLLAVKPGPHRFAIVVDPLSEEERTLEVAFEHPTEGIDIDVD